MLVRIYFLNPSFRILINFEKTIILKASKREKIFTKTMITRWMVKKMILNKRIKILWRRPRGLSKSKSKNRNFIH